MRRTCFRKMHCPIARSRKRVGAWCLILRDAPHGFRRFDEFQESLGVATGRIRRSARRKVEAGAA
jgi:DNA-binding HxlR family transcriptional regulator